MHHNHHHHGAPANLTPEGLRRNRICCTVFMMIFGIAVLAPGIVLLVVSQQQDDNDLHDPRKPLIIPGCVFIVIGTIFLSIGLFFIFMLCAGKEESVPCFKNRLNASAVPVAAPNAGAYNYDAAAATGPYNNISNNNQPFGYHTTVHPHANLYNYNASPAANMQSPQVAYGVVMQDNNSHHSPYPPSSSGGYGTPQPYLSSTPGGPISYTK